MDYHSLQHTQNLVKNDVFPKEIIQFSILDD
jgi:hypothetical protein